MNEQLIKFIELCLTDGIITDKEREVIFRKAVEFNVDTDECEIILESMIQQKNMSKTTTVSKNEIVTDVNTEINNSEKDSLFKEAAELVVEFQKASEDFLKDKLKIATNRACRLIEQLVTTGLINKINENNEYKINIRNGVYLKHFLTSGEIKKIYDYSFTNLSKLEKSNGAKIPNFNEDGYKYNLNLGDRIVEMNFCDEEDFDCFFMPTVKNGFKSIDDFFAEIKPKDDYIQFFEKLFAFGTLYKKIKKYPNGDFFLGKIVDEKANGFGELNITINDLFSNKKTKYIGHFFNDTFLEGTIICYEPDEIKHIALQNINDCTEYRDVRFLNNKYLCSTIYYPNGDNFEGTVINFKRHGEGKLTKANGNIVEGTWENDTIIMENLIVERDSLFRKASEVVVEAQQGSASLLQRKLYLGYNRAGRLIDELENAGIVGAFDGVNPRKINIPNLKSLEHFFATGEIKNIQNNSIINNDNLNNNAELNEFYEDVIRWNNNKDYIFTVKNCEEKEKKYPNLFENISLTNKYLWALYKDGVSIYSLKLKETKIQVLERILKKINNSDKLNHDTIGLFYLEAGKDNNDLAFLEKALKYFKSHDYNDKEFGNKRINNLQMLIKLKSLGINSTLEEEFINGNYTKLWKVNCFVNEPFYWNGKLERWINSNPIFYIPSNGIMTEKGAIAFIKAKWKVINTYTIDNSSWEKRGGKELDKTKIEIIEINEIVFN
jgi:hypothetical protein